MRPLISLRSTLKRLRRANHIFGRVAVIRVSLDNWISHRIIAGESVLQTEAR